LVLGRYWLRRPHDPDFAAFALFRDRDGLFLDIGANAGQSALSFRLFNDAPILSLEPNPEHEADLRLLRRVLSGFDYLPIAASDQTGVATLHVPTFRGATITGEGTLVAPDSPASFWASQNLAPGHRELATTSYQVPARRLDELALKPAFVKIDVEGFELPVIRGLTETLQRTRPIVLVERSQDFPDVRALLESLGYEARRFDSHNRCWHSYTDDDGSNAYFLPQAQGST